LIAMARPDKAPGRRAVSWVRTAGPSYLLEGDPMVTTLALSELQHEHRCVMPSLRESAGTARRWSAQAMGNQDLTTELREHVCLGLSELVANAALHGSCEVVAVRLVLQDGRVRVEVRERLTEGQAKSPTLMSPGRDAERCRGLLILDV